MDLSEARSLLGGHWSSFVGAVFDPAVRSVPGGVQQYVWQSLSNFYLSRGESLPGGSFQAVNRLLSVAGEQRQAQLSLSRALASFEQTGRDSVLLANHIAPGIDTRALNQMPLGPQFRVTYLTQELIEGESVISYRTWDAGFGLPNSVSGLVDTINEVAPFEASDYGYEWAGVATPVAITSY